MKLSVTEKPKTRGMGINKNPTICLNMIVKNEASVIVSTFDNLAKYIKFDYWVISDTGSTDNTKEIIRSYFLNKGIPGELVEHPWKNFGYNRSKALECAYDKTDYLLIFDADDSIEGNLVLPFMNVANDANHKHADSYMLKIGKGLEYCRPLIVNNRKKWMFKGVLHEFLSHMEPVVNSDVRILGDYHVNSGRGGDRSKNPTKYYDDAIILRNAYAEEMKLPDQGLAGRYAFYCARSYRDAGSNYNDDAIQWYKVVLGRQHWNQEQYYSALEIGKIYKEQNKIEEAVKYWMKTLEYDYDRIEGLLHAIEYWHHSNMHILVNALYHKFKNYKCEFAGKLFVYTHMYHDRLEYFNSLSAHQCNDKESGYVCSKKCILNRKLHIHELKQVLHNLVPVYKDLLEKDQYTLPMFYALDNIIADHNDLVFDQNIVDLWNSLFKKNRHYLVNASSTSSADITKSIRKNTTISTSNIAKGIAPRVLISFTTCKRFDLFKETINSIINHWTDVDKINYWFCVDDNSSNDDRQKMKKTYNWIDYYMKTPSEKGHRESMNIIWNKLNALKPDYWIHMEDDFLFYYPCDYVGKSINILEAFRKNKETANIRQVVFNQNYAEIIDDYNILGHLPSFLPDAVIHDHKYENILKYMNAHYWPHYSLRPSMLDVKTILSLGNFDSPNRFFEKDYAHKWQSANYRTAFFKRITNRHIGRLTTEIISGEVKNAYELNAEEQFLNKKKGTGAPANIKIINLERRKDRREMMSALFEKHSIENYGFIEAVDGNVLESTLALKKVFDGNDFGSRCGVIGCALTHLRLWEQLLQDKDNTHYIIFEDDITFAENMNERLKELNDEMAQTDMLMIGYHMFEEKRNNLKDIYDNILDVASKLTIAALNQDLYIGGFYAYSINKTGAEKLVNYIKTNGIKHGIDYIIKLMPELQLKETQPHIVFSVWNEAGKKIDTDIQTNYKSIDLKNVLEDQFVFHPRLDQIDHDLYYKPAKTITELMANAMKDPKCVAFNTLGFYKHKIEILTTSRYFNEQDGIYIKKPRVENPAPEQVPVPVIEPEQAPAPMPVIEPEVMPAPVIEPMPEPEPVTFPELGHIVFIPDGRLGNAFFRYLGCAVLNIKNPELKYILKDQHKPSPDLSTINVTDPNFEYNYYNTAFAKSDVIMKGYFQIDHFYLNNKPAIIEYMRAHKHEHVIETDLKEKYTMVKLIDDILLENSQYYDIVIHLRLDDFNGRPDFIETADYFQLFETIDFTAKKIGIVTERPKRPNDIEYLNACVQWFQSRNLTVTVESNTMMIDFNIMKQAKELISSMSTLAWAAAYLSTHIQKCYMPDYNFSNMPPDRGLGNFKHPITNTQLFKVKTTPTTAALSLVKPYVVHLPLKEYSFRLPYINSLAETLNTISLDIQIFKAVNGREIIVQNTEEEHMKTLLLPTGETYKYDTTVRTNNNRMCAGELGCALSHISLYKQLLEQECEGTSYLIIEDDAELVKTPAELCILLNHVPADADLCHLALSDCFPFIKTTQTNEHFFECKKQYFNRTTAYLITKKGARKIIDFTNNSINLPSDDLFGHMHRTVPDFRFYVPREYYFKERAESTSMMIKV